MYIYSERGLCVNRYIVPLKKCKKNGINVLYYTDLGYKTFLKEKIYTDKNELIKTIFTA